LIHVPRKAFRQAGKGRETDSQSDKVLDDVRGLAWKKFAGRFEELAEIARLHPNTVNAFVWGDTKRPQFETIVRLLVALGLYHKLEELLRIDKPVSRVAAAKRR
jgi:hypothetical protein